MVSSETPSSEIDDVNGKETHLEGQTKNFSSGSGTIMPMEEKSAHSLNSDKPLSLSMVTSDPPINCAVEGFSTEVIREMSETTSQVHVSLTPPTPQLQGAWTKPLMKTGVTGSSLMADNNAAMETTEWPALSTKEIGRKKDQVVVNRSKTSNQAKRADDLSTQRIKIPTDKDRFPWAARMNPQTRNLHRVTVPEYLEDGTPKVTIPDYVLRHGLQNHKEYVIGQFYRCLVPPGGLVYAVLNRIWGRKCEIFVRKLSEFSYIFHIPDESTRKFVLQRGLWHVDDCIMFVAPWTSFESLTLPEITSIPVWVTLKNIPSNLYSILGIEWIASGVGEPMLSYKPWLDPTMLGEAKIMVEVELDKPFPQKVAAWDKQGNFSLVDVEYSWFPTSCEKCGQLGHKSKRCLSISGNKAASPAGGRQDTYVANVFPSTADASATGTVTKTAVEVPAETSQEANAAERDASTSDNTLLSQGHTSMPLPKVQSNSQQNISHAPAANKPATPKENTTICCDENTPHHCIEKENVSTVVDEVKSTTVDELVSLATISVLESMYESPTVICINEKTDASPTEAAPTKKNNEFPVNQTSTVVFKEDIRRGEIDMGSNKFASLISYEGEEEDQMDLDECSDPIDVLTPQEKRLLRERPVKPSAKAMEWQMQSTSRGRGNRGRGNRGRPR